MPLSVGDKLGPYEILAPLGSGGMGEVYRARDTNLGRDVAVKVLLPAFARDPERLARFEREARVLASLNHPGIATLHGFEQAEGAPFLVMELVEGETLQSPLPLDEALALSRQICEALEAAHEKGVVHRDLKPANIKITPSGKVKLLDFGLAKAFTGDSAAGDPRHSPTASLGTQLGTILGTAAYMSPEQARGRPIDRRTDVWAFGCVLYEMLTGRQAFGGTDVADILAAVVRGEPDWAALPPSTPPHLKRLLERCLQKDPARRLRDIGDVAMELDTPPAEAPAPSPVVPARRSSLVPWAVAALATLAALVLGWLHIHPTPPTERTVRLLVSPPEKETFWSYDSPAVSPDGEKLAFTAVDPDGRRRIWVRSLDSLTISPLAGADKGMRPFWSPDSHSIAFFADGKLKKADLRGGPPQTLCDAGISNPFGAWGRDGVILFGSGNSDTGVRTLSRVAATGGEVRLATTLDVSRQEAGHDYPQFLPDGRHFIYLAQSARSENTGIYAGSLDSKGTKRLVSTYTNAAYAGSPSGSGYLLFTRDDALMAQAFDATRLELTGAPLLVTQPVSMSTIVRARLMAMFSVSENGVLAYRTGGSTAAKELVWFDRQGKRLGTVGEPAEYSNPALSPDEKKLVVCRMNPQAKTRDLWLFDLARGTSSRFTFDPADDRNPVWSPDGSRIAFSSPRRGALYDLYVKAATGSGADEVLLESREDKVAQDWTPDGRFILFQQGGGIWTSPLEGDRKPKGPLGLGLSPRVSPNGRWVAYYSDESGRVEVYVQSFPPSGGRWQVSTAGGAYPQWRRDGKELFYLADDKLMAVDVKTDAPVFEKAIPKPLFSVRVETLTRHSHYEVAANGQRFLVVTPVEAPASPITLVTNWTAGLKR
jgi:serine/threonine protein kinase